MDVAAQDAYGTEERLPSVEDLAAFFARIPRAANVVVVALADREYPYVQTHLKNDKGYVYFWDDEDVAGAFALGDYYDGYDLDGADYEEMPWPGGDPIGVPFAAVLRVETAVRVVQEFAATAVRPTSVGWYDLE